MLNMRQHHFLSTIVTFLSVFCSQVAAKDGLRRKTEWERGMEPAPSPKTNAHLTVANRRHPHQEVADSGIGDGNFGVRIVGGDLADPLEYPYFTDLGGCGATLIAPRVLLSAGKATSF
jgi:hypothetical protein